jgi:hypothetical protein
MLPVGDERASDHPIIDLVMNIARALLAVLALGSCGIDAVHATPTTSGGSSGRGVSGNQSTGGGTGGGTEQDAGLFPPDLDGGNTGPTSICGDGGICADGVCCGGTCCVIGDLCCSEVCTTPTLDRPFCTF